MTGAVAAVLVVLAWRDVVAGQWLGVPLAAFAVLVVLHERAHRARARAQRAVAHYRSGLRRIDDDWMGRGVTGEELRPAEHPYAGDLDVLGRGSMFELLCTAKTAGGRRCLAQWLLHPASLPEIRERQAAVDDLRSRLDLREALDMAGEHFDDELDPTILVEWGTAAAHIEPGQARRWGVLAWLVPSLTLGALGVWIWGSWGPGPFVVMLGVTWVLGRWTRRFVVRAHVGAQRSARQLEVLARVLACLEGERGSAPLRQRLHAQLVSGQRSASACIRGLALRVAWAEAAKAQLFVPVAFVLAWRLHFALALHRWRRTHGPSIEGWLHALAQLEALASVSAYAYEHPDDPFPELVEGAPTLEGEALRHPLLPAAASVDNPVSLGGQVQARIVSGSNMSGKSTYLRTVGTNVVLALAGAPVRAAALRLSALRIGATLRVQDSLAEGASRFFAEITRLRSIVAEADRGPGVLFLLDEILHGTNSHDRRAGGHAVVHGLLDRGGLGLVTTHDLALAEGNEDPRIVNVHFCDELRGTTLHFDYRLRDGIVRTSNALALMEAVGLPVSKGFGATAELGDVS